MPVNAPGSDGSVPPAQAIEGDEELVVDQDLPVIANPPAASDQCLPGEYAPVPGDCGAFTVCKDGKRYDQRCASGLHFVRDKNSCDWPDNSDCKEPSASPKSQVADQRLAYFFFFLITNQPFFLSSINRS